MKNHKAYRLFVGRAATMDDSGIVVDPDPNAGKAVLLEVRRGGSPQFGACHFSSHEELQDFVAQLQSAGAEAFGRVPCLLTDN